MASLAGFLVMKNAFVELRNMDSLDRFLALAIDGPVVILKHSDTCGVSSRAYAEMSKLERPVGLITVQTARALSDEVERRLSVGHETPQVLILRNGKVVWTASHGAVRAEAVEAAVRESGGQSGQ
jgi:bacillithiol system protein YtxJ